ncbi:MAG TPA: PDZ domain-containing protein, partial [Anaerolineae bacterium]|nr:PDZ domain-containing protein [Anaerolineae bacterium]
MIITILGLIIALSTVVFIHELGHYASAKLSGIVVEEFGFGYPPRLLAFWRTKGKVIIDGQEIAIPRKVELPEGLQARSVVRYETETDSQGRRVLTRIQSADSTNPDDLPTGYVEFFDPGTLFSLNAIPFGGFAKMLGEEDPTFPGSLASKSKRTRVFVLSAGALMNLVSAVFFFALAFALGGPAIAEPENAVITAVAPGSPAEAVGLQPGDVILKTDDVEILAAADLPAYVQAHRGEPIVLTIQRGDDLLEITVVPRLDPPP